MIAYLDSSVLLRILLNQENKLKEFSKLTRPVASKLLKTECLRTLDRCRLLGLLDQKEYLRVVDDFYQGLDSIELVDLTDAILDRAASGFPVALGTLDAIHLSSAIRWHEHTGIMPKFLTHDEVLGQAARALGFDVLG